MAAVGPVRRAMHRLAFVAGAALVAATIFPAAADAQAASASTETPLKIMPLGDSITAGVGAAGNDPQDGGYRGPLAALLARNGYRTRFVGTRSDYAATIADHAHEGWPGYVVRSFPSDPGAGQLLGAVTGRALRAAEPDLILLMAGTNDLLRLGRPGYDLASIAASLDLLIGQIAGDRPATRLIVAPVVDSPLIAADALEQFSADLALTVAGYAARGTAVSYAPEMLHAVPRDAAHFPDGLHPSGPGAYAAIARVWFAAIAETAGPAGSGG